MKTPRLSFAWLAAVVVAGMAAAGCTSEPRRNGSGEGRETPPPGTSEGSDEAGSLERSAKDAARDVKEAAREAGQDIKEAAGDVKDAAREAGRDARDAGEGLGAKVDAVKQLADVKMALMADPNLDSSGINVDADEATKTIHLKGRVPTAAQKAAAERIARDKARGYRIHNVLTVGR